MPSPFESTSSRILVLSRAVTVTLDDPAPVIFIAPEEGLAVPVPWYGVVVIKVTVPPSAELVTVPLAERV